MKEIHFSIGENLDSAYQLLQSESKRLGEVCYGIFNEKELYSTDSLDDVYVKILGNTKAEYDKEVQDWLDEYDRKEKEYKDNIPNLIPVYCGKARGVILENQYEYWDKIVPIRLGDLYHGMELDSTLDLCKIMRDESIPYDKRIRKAYKAFMDQNHSGMSASLVASMLKVFCLNGNELADAVMSFKFEKENK